MTGKITNFAVKIWIRKQQLFFLQRQNKKRREEGGEGGERRRKRRDLLKPFQWSDISALQTVRVHICSCRVWASERVAWTCVGLCVWRVWACGSVSVCTSVYVHMCCALCHNKKPTVTAVKKLNTTHRKQSTTRVAVPLLFLFFENAS